jgi:hypothetical protein
VFAVSNPPNHAVRFLDAEVSHHSSFPPLSAGSSLPTALATRPASLDAIENDNSTSLSSEIPRLLPSPFASNPARILDAESIRITAVKAFCPISLAPCAARWRLALKNHETKFMRPFRVCRQCVF